MFFVFALAYYTNQTSETFVRTLYLRYRACTDLPSVCKSLCKRSKHILFLNSWDLGLRFNSVRCLSHNNEMNVPLRNVNQWRSPSECFTTTMQIFHQNYHSCLGKLIPLILLYQWMRKKICPMEVKNGLASLCICNQFDW